ncbi:hypothetical protein AAMO2058_000929700 [Amorphochlora amoebiformis]
MHRVRNAKVISPKYWTALYTAQISHKTHPRPMSDPKDSASIRKDPSLGFHWGVGILFFSIIIGLSVWTYRELVRLEAKRVRLQMLGTPNESFAWLVIIFVSSLMPVLRNGANASIPCAFVVVWTQFGFSAVTSLYLNRTLEFTAKTAKIILVRHSLEESTTKNVSAHYKRKIRFAKNATRVLTPKNLKRILVGIFVVLFLMIFADPDNSALLLQGEEPTECVDKSRLFLILFFLAWTSIYTGIAKWCRLHDPYHAIFKFMVLDVVLILLAIMGLTLFEILPRYHLAIMIWEFVGILMLVCWYLELYLPLRLTRKKLFEAKKYTQGSQHTEYLSQGENGETRSISDERFLLNTLINPKLLALYQQHVIKEWAPENLDFLKQSVIFWLVTMRSLKLCLKGRESKTSRGTKKALNSAIKSACRIYSTFIHPDSPKLVNLPGNIFITLRSTFEAKEFEQFLGDYSVTSRADSRRSSRSSLKRFPKKSNHSFMRSGMGVDMLFDKEGKSPSQKANSVASESDKESTWKFRSETSKRRYDSVKSSYEIKSSKSTRNANIPQRDFCTAIAELACEGSDIQVESYLSSIQTTALRENKDKVFDESQKDTLKRLAEVMNIFEPARKDIFYLMACDSHRRFRNREDIRKIMDEINDSAAMQC